MIQGYQVSLWATSTREAQHKFEVEHHSHKNEWTNSTSSTASL